MWRFIGRLFGSRVLADSLCNSRAIMGFVVGEFHRDHNHEPAFLDAVETSLNLLWKHDRSRFKRARRNICIIYNASLMSSAEYHRQFQACAMDYSRFSPEWRENEAFPAYIAGLLVHEVTHGLIDRKCSRRGRDPIREERICHREQWRCFDRLAKATDLTVDEHWLAERKEYDPRWHRAYYKMSPLARIRRRLKLLYDVDGFWGYLRQVLFS